MKINIEGGFVEFSETEDNEIGISIGCEHFNDDGTRKDTVINTATVTKEQFKNLIKDFL